MSDTQTVSPVPAPEGSAREAGRIDAVHRLAMARKIHPELGRSEAQARVSLAVAILAMDEVDERIANGEKIHSLQEQANIELASRAYQQALANLLRGES